MAGSEGTLRHAGHYLGLMDKGAEALTTSASLDPKDPASEEKMQESTFELMAITALLDVEGTVVAAAKRVLLDNGNHYETTAAAPQGSSSDSSTGVKDDEGGGIGSFFGALFSTSSAPSNSATESSTDGTPVAAMDATAVHTTRCEALLILANILEAAKSSNPDPYSWRTAFAQAAAATAR